MTRFQKLTLSTAAATYLLVVVGAIVRSTDSGMGCPDWPLCHGSLLPPLGDTSAWIEWTHRTIAAAIGLLVLWVAVSAWRNYRGRRSIVWAALAALVVTIIQAALGMVTVETSNAGPTVTLHLATAMILLALLTYLAVRVTYPAALPDRGGSQRFTLLAAFTALCVYALLLFGSHVTETTGAALVFPDWPLFGGALVPHFSGDPTVAAQQTAQFLHRVVAVVVGLIVLAEGYAVMKTQRHRPVLIAFVHTALALFLIQAIVGAAQIFTHLAAWSVVLHDALGAGIWALLVATAVHSYCLARLEGTPLLARHGGSSDEDLRHRAPAGGTVASAGPGGAVSNAVAVERELLEDAPFTPLAAAVPAAAVPAAAVAPASLRARVRAYVALTKPRVIELLLVTTVPAMVLATRDVPGIRVETWLGLVVATLIGGALAAGSANAINCYIDRDIDEVMSRTRRRPLPAHAVDPENALLFGLALGVIAFAWLLVFTNLLAAFLALLAIAFYVVVYTLLLKRSTPQNIVIGGAAGALPPVIGWAAVTGNVALPALLLFLIVFYWTPPHFWALSVRLSRDYAAAGVPMLPVVRGVRETGRQIAFYTLLLVLLTLAFGEIADMGIVYLVGATVLGALFLREAIRLWRDGTGAGALHLYRFSITYLTLLFALIALDVLVPIAL